MTSWQFSILQHTASFECDGRVLHITKQQHAPQPRGTLFFYEKPFLRPRILVALTRLCYSLFSIHYPFQNSILNGSACFRGVFSWIGAVRCITCLSPYPPQKLSTDTCFYWLEKQFDLLCHCFDFPRVFSGGWVGGFRGKN